MKCNFNSWTKLRGVYQASRTVYSGQQLRSLLNPFTFFILFPSLGCLESCLEHVWLGATQILEQKIFMQICDSLLCSFLLSRCFLLGLQFFQQYQTLSYDSSVLEDFHFLLQVQPLLWKEWMVLSEEQLYTRGSHSVISFLQGVDSFQFPSTFGHSPILPNTFKIFCLEFYIIIDRIKYKLI